MTEFSPVVMKTLRSGAERRCSYEKHAAKKKTARIKNAAHVTQLHKLAVNIPPSETLPQTGGPAHSLSDSRARKTKTGFSAAPAFVAHSSDASSIRGLNAKTRNGEG